MKIGRVALFWAGYAVILYLAAYPRMMAPAAWGQLVWGALSSFAILGLTLYLLKREGRTAADVGLRFESTSILRFLVGVFLGCAIYAIMILITSLIAGPIQVTRADSPAIAIIVLTLGTYLALSVMEELGFRGYPLRTLVEALGRWQAMAVVAVAFSLSHLMYGWSWDTILLGVLPNAILFGVVALASGGLAMPIGLHAAVNAARWAAGETGTPGLWSMRIDTPDPAATSLRAALTGAAVTVLVSAVVWWWYRSKGGTADPAWG